MILEILLGHGIYSSFPFWMSFGMGQKRMNKQIGEPWLDKDKMIWVILRLLMTYSLVSSVISPGSSRGRSGRRSGTTGPSRLRQREMTRSTPATAGGIPTLEQENSASQTASCVKTVSSFPSNLIGEIARTQHCILKNNTSICL